MPIEPMYRTAEVAVALGCSPSHVRNLIKTRRLKATDIGLGRKVWRVTESAVADYRETRDADPETSRPNLVLIQSSAA